MATAGEHLRLYGDIRKVVLARLFALGDVFRNDFIQEGASPEIDRTTFLAADAAERQHMLWSQGADRDNPWLFGAQLITALAQEAWLGMPASEALLDRAMRSCEALFATIFAGLPLRWDPVTSDDWWTPPVGGASLARDFLVRGNGQGYFFDVRSSDPRHFPYINKQTGLHFMAKRLWERYDADRGQYLDTYRDRETSADEMVGVILTYVVAAEATSSNSLRATCRFRLEQILTYLADHAFLMVQPNGGLSSRGAGGALPALEWPFRRAIERASDGIDLSVIQTASIQDALAAAGIWPLFEDVTNKTMAAMWLAAPVLASIAVAAQVGVVTSLTGFPLPPNVLAELEMLANTVGGVVGFNPFFDLNPGQLGFAAGLYLAREGFDVANDTAQSDIALASLITSLAPQERYWTFVEMSTRKGPTAPWSTGFVPFLGLMSVGDDHRGAADLYLSWLTNRRAANIDQFTSADIPYVGYSTSCMASAVALMLRSSAEWSEANNAAEEVALLGKLDERYNDFTADGGPFLLDNKEIRCALDYLVGVALAWRYRRTRELLGLNLTATELPALPDRTVPFPAPAVPRVVVDDALVPVPAIQGVPVPVFDANNEAELFLATSPRRPRVPAFTLSFPTDDPVLYEDTFDVGPGKEVATGAVVQWGDLLEIEAVGQLTIGGQAIEPGGVTDSQLWNTGYPLHAGIDASAAAHGLLARLNNYVLIGARRKLRWLFPQEAFVYLRLNQFRKEGNGSFQVTVRVRGGRRPLSRFLQVDCVKRLEPPPMDDRPAGWHASRRIIGIGGTHRNGEIWRLTLEEAAGAQSTGGVFFVRSAGTVAAEVKITQSAGGTFRARTWPDSRSPNNLSHLSVCP